MSRVLIVKREGGRGFAVLIAFSRRSCCFTIPWRAHSVRQKGYGSWTSAWDLGACLCGAAQEVTVVRDDGLKLAASVYTEGAAERRPAIVLLHGNTHRGRRLPLYKVLASRLAERGYVVLTLDRAGFG
jgi:predicted acyl esterase